MRQLQSRLIYGSFFLYYALTHSLNPFSLSFSKTKELSPLLFPMPPCPITPKSWEDTLAAFFASLAFVGGGEICSSCLPLCKGVFIWKNRGRDGIWWNGSSRGCHINCPFLCLWPCPCPRVSGQIWTCLDRSVHQCCSDLRESHSPQNKASKLISPQSQTLLGGG